MDIRAIREGSPRARCPALPRRTVLGLAAAVPLLASCGSPSIHGRVPPPDVPVRVRTRWTRRPDGPVPSVGDEGLPIRVIANHGAQPAVERGALVGHLPDRAAATYVQQALPDKVRRIGAVFGFDPGTADGSLTLVAWDPRARLTSHCHIAFAPDRWIASTVEGGELSEYAREDYPTPLVTDGRPYRVEIVFDGPVAHVAVPGGPILGVEDETIARAGGSVPCWEFYRADSGGAGVRLYETWAG